MIDLTGKVAVVTGSSRGIGAAIAIVLAQQGAKVIVNHRNSAESADAVRQTITDLGGEAAVIQADVSEFDDAQHLIKETIRTFGQIDILVNNAATNQPHALNAVDYAGWQAAWRTVIGVNLVGAANVSYCVARHMIERQSGRIVNVSSRGAFRGEPDNPAYGASKAGLNALSQSLAQYLAPHNIFVSAVAPGFVETERVQKSIEERGARQQSPLGRVARPEEVAYTVLFLASAGAEFLTGAVVDVNGASYLR